jgi:hypothetical protein
MELDWCIQENNNESQLFNDNSIIKNNKDNGFTNIKKQVSLGNQKIAKELKVNDCFSLDLKTTNKISVLEIMNYLSFVSNNLRTIIRNKNLISGFDNNNFENLMKYLSWLKNACENLKIHFNNTKKRDNLNDAVFKPFKTSSYKFCNYKNSCSIHKYKNKTCDKNHFVFEMVLLDINKLIESLNLITKDNLDFINWIFSDKCIKIYIDENTNSTNSTNSLENFIIEKYNSNDFLNDSDNVYFINKNVIFKCFDVISYVLNKMYEESCNFLIYDIESLLINL